jgi:serine phosphatase RsbU (regulator of sigma subunit)
MAVDKKPDDRELDSDSGQVFEWAAYGRPCAGERVSGDVALAVTVEHKLLVVLIDVLGHGPEAHRLAVKMAAYIKDHPVAVPSTMIENLDRTFKGSRGSAAGCAVLDAHSDTIAFAGIGNPNFRILSSSQTVTLPASAGIIGVGTRTPVIHRARLLPGDLLIGCSDGVAEGFQVADYPQIFFHNIWAVARSVVKRFGKNHDDATCVAVRRLKS